MDPTSDPTSDPISDPLALYIHWPFCLAKCPYCDFNSHVRDRIDQRRFAAALRRELAWEAARLNAPTNLPLPLREGAGGRGGTGEPDVDRPLPQPPPTRGGGSPVRRKLASIFFGGGTPSLMDPATVADLIADATQLFDADKTVEITLEANPTSIEAGRFAAFRQAGVNRVSIGVQSLHDAPLKMLGRQHSAAQAIAALELARQEFPRVSFDLIYARPGQTLPAWRAELRQALALAADHLSLYQLTIEPGTAFATLHQRGEILLPDDETAAALYDATAEEAEKFGLLPYEVSNYAQPGAESRHNLAYWRYGDYAGIGPGAHGRVSLGAHLYATRRHRAPEPWAERVERDGHGTTEETPVPPQDRAREMLLMGLRLTEGIDEARFAARTGIAFDDAVDPDTLARALDEDYLSRATGRVRATAEGRKRLDALLGALAV